MDIAGMQPYLFPYIGYFQLINLVDCFVIADNLQFINQGWINRNRVLVHGREHLITFPIIKDSAYLSINERYFVDDSKEKYKGKILNTLNHAYRKAPKFDTCYALIEEILNFENKNVAKFIINSLELICTYLDIKTKLVVESEFTIPSELGPQDRIIYLCRKLGADRCINAIGGIELYSVKEFQENGLTLEFIKTKTSLNYKQFNYKFVPNLSIIDVMMFNSVIEIRSLLGEFELLGGKC